MIKYTQEEAFASSMEYFGGDELAASVFISKYALRDSDGNILEKTPADMHRRLAKEFARIESKYPSPVSEEEIYGYLSRWEIVPQGSPMSAMGNPYKIQSLSNCFVIDSPQDSYGGILFADQEQAQIMKRRGGVGFDISTIRPKGMHTANAAGTTDGIGVFMERFSNTCREVAQGGRRGALMLSISVDHPEIETFINIKRDLKKVTGANISIRLTDAFMQAVKDEAEYILHWPVDVPTKDAKVTKAVKAKEVWDQIIDAAWTSAEPGLLFWDTVQKNTPTEAYKSLGYGSVSTNPCIVGSTLLATADGRNAVSIKQLAEEGKDVPVYSTNPQTGRVEIKRGRNPRLTKKAAEVWKLTLDDGSFLVATPDHRIMKRDCTYVELKALQSGDSVFPFSSFNSNGYRQVCNTGIEMTGGARRNRRQYRLIYEFHHGPADAKNFAIHHIDHNSLNDSIENMQVMTHKEHHELHSKNMLGDLNPYHRMTPGWKKNFATHPGESNGRYSGHSNDQLLEHGRELFKTYGKITGKIWTDHAKENGLPQFISSEFRFGTWQNFVNQVSNNHKVVSVERFGTEDVYNITVDDNHNYHVITSREDDKFVVSSGICVKNCGEIVLSPYDSCRLLLLNLSKFVKNPFDQGATFDYVKFGTAARLSQRLMDDLVDLELEAIDTILSKIEADPESPAVKHAELELWKKIRNAAAKGRRTGLGITAMGDALAMLNIRYGSQESVDKTEEIYKVLEVNAYRSTVRMAAERGPFPIFSHELEADHAFIQKVVSVDPELKADYLRYGRRNIALTTTAPAGSVSCLTQTTSGIEPAFLVSYTRRKKITSTDVTSRVDFIDQLGDKWQEYKVYHHNYKKWMEVTGNGDEIEKSPYLGATSNDIDWDMSVKLQAAAQKWVCHSLSKTCNLPNATTRETVAQVYMSAWETGCKGFTVYRDGSRTGVLISSESSKQDENDTDTDNQPSAITENHAPKRLKELSCDIHRINVKGNSGSESYLVLVGIMEGKPYEVFCGLSSHVEVPKKAKRGLLIKNGKKDGIATYNLSIPVGDDDVVIFKDVVELFANPLHGAFTRSLSLALRHGIPVQYVVEQLQKDKHSDMQSFSRVIARTLKGYIPDGTKSSSDKKCQSCGAEDGLIYQEGCLTCKACGNSKCG